MLPSQTQQPDLPFDPAEALMILDEARQLALDLHGNVRTEVKGDQTLVTEADRRLEAFLRERLAALTPGWSFLGEEEGLSGDPLAPCWVIDPIDGTTNFVRGIPLWSISVGAVAQGAPIFGMLEMPELSETLWAVPGAGAWRRWQGKVTRLKVEDRLPIMQEDPIAANTTVERNLDFSLLTNRLRNFGSLAYHLCLLAKGCTVGNIAQHHKLYDIAAGICVCIEAGCEVRYLDGTPWEAIVTPAMENRALLTAPPATLAYLLDNLAPKTSTEEFPFKAPVRTNY